jgi:hypothetical protein
VTDFIGDSLCDEVFADLAELALGILSGRRRSEVLDHVESCQRCGAELERLSTVADSLLLLSPEVEAPLGFELRLAERLQPSPVTRLARRRTRVVMLAAAAVVTIVLGFGAGALVNSGGGSNPVQFATLTSANLSSGGHDVGEVMIAGGSPGWMFMTIDAGPWTGKVTCELTLVGGAVQRIGVFELSNGYGSWAAPLHSPAGQVLAARLVAADGSVLASAHLAA